MRKPAIFLCGALLLLWGCASRTINGVKTHVGKETATIENEAVRLTFDLKTGTYCAFDKAKGVRTVYDAYAAVNDYDTRSAESRTAEVRSAESPLGQGTTLRVTSGRTGEPELLFDFTLYPDRPFVILHGGLRNATDSIVQVRSIAPLNAARLFEGLDLSQNFRVLDGEGGGATTRMRQVPSLGSQNNIVLHFGDDARHHSLVAGGVSYAEFAKYVRLSDGLKRERQLRENPPFGLTLVNYTDFGGGVSEKSEGPRFEAGEVSEMYFESSSAYPEAKSVIWAADEIVLDVKGLERGKDYCLGLAWSDDSRSRWQSVWLEQDGKRTQGLPPTRLPSLNKDYPPQEVWFDLPQTDAKETRLVIKRERGLNAVLSEAILLEGRLPAGVAGKLREVETAPPRHEDAKLTLYAADPVGKRVDPGQTYLPEADAFYLAFSTDNPLEAAEQYAAALKTLQRIELNHYYFPSICMWVAMEPKYGGNILLGTNDSPGAVAEMERVKASGWLKYTTMAIRLVPDCYADNNQNGWWDDEHWRMHGSGTQDPGMELKGGHYREPYETTEKWAQAVIALGGKPFIYTQTGVRSNDYAERFPQHMLFNEAYRELPQHDPMNKNYGSYDFTDPGFYAHMQDVYRNMRDGGIQGIMFDYPYTGWALYGGMDDPYATAGGAYRTLFRLCREGLGLDAYLHERNIKYGSDITLGLVSSQRTWGDTDVITWDMVSLSGLRWYKNRTVVNYDMDSKNLLKAQPDDSADGIHKLLTMSYTAAARFLLANSFGTLSPEHIYKLSRIFPYPQTAQSARPLDAFTADYPRVYGYKVCDGWQALTFFNEDEQNPKTIGIDLAGIEGRGGAGMDPAKTYYVYDFWNDRLVGRYRGGDRLEQTLRRGEARQMAVREALPYPQVLSSDRHIMQGLMELSAVQWDEEAGTLSGLAELIGGETMTLTIAPNGKRFVHAFIDQGELVTAGTDDGLLRVRLTAPENRNAAWSVKFE